MSVKAKRSALIVAVLMVAVVVGQAQGQEAKTENENVALVNGVAITQKAYQSQIGQMKQQAMQQAMQQGRQLDAAMLETIQKDALDSLINQELLYKESQKTGIQIEKSAVDGQIEQFKKRFPTEAAYQAQLKDGDLTEAILRSHIEKGMAIRRLVQEHVVDKIEITDAQAREFYDAHPDYFKQPEMVKASHILVKVEKGADASQMAAADQKIEMIQQKLKNGEAFAALAQQFSEGPSRSSGGDLGYFRRGQMVAPFEQAAFAMAPEQISDKVVTQFGYHLIKVTGKKEAGTVSYPESKEKITGHLKRVKSDQAVKSYIRSLREAADIQVL